MTSKASALKCTTHYRARKNEIIDDTGNQIAVVLPSNCTMKAASAMAAYAAQQMNHEARVKERRAMKSPQEAKP